MSEHDDEGTLSALPKGFVAPPWAPPESSNSTTTSADQPKVPVSGAVQVHCSLVKTWWRMFANNSIHFN